MLLSGNDEHGDGHDKCRQSNNDRGDADCSPSHLKCSPYLVDGALNPRITTLLRAVVGAFILFPGDCPCCRLDVQFHIFWGWQGLVSPIIAGRSFFVRAQCCFRLVPAPTIYEASCRQSSLFHKSVLISIFAVKGVLERWINGRFAEAERLSHLQRRTFLFLAQLGLRDGALK